MPQGFDTSKDFASYSCLGITYTLGSTLTVPAGKSLSGSMAINDPVNCQGTIAAASGGFINLNNGLVLSGTGNVRLGSGTLTVNDLLSGISGGTLAASGFHVGSGGTGQFGQSGGSVAVSSLTLGSERVRQRDLYARRRLLGGQRIRGGQRSGDLQPDWRRQ